MDHRQFELFKVVADDLDYLRQEWNSNPSDTSLRLGSVALRRLLLEGVLNTAWRESGMLGRITIPAPNLDKEINADSGIFSGFAGGAHYKDVFAKLGILHRGPEGGASGQPEPEDENYRLNKFLDSTGLYFEKKRITRREVISYVANKLGGAHLDFNRESDLYKTIAGAEAQFTFMDKNAVFIELLAIGQLVTNSADIIVLGSHLRSLINMRSTSAGSSRA
jgi:hypothetical protein